MRLSIVNSGAPGTASLLAPLFEGLAEHPGVQLLALEQSPARDCGKSGWLAWGACSAEAAPAAKAGCHHDGYRLVRVPTYFCCRRHAAAQVLARDYRRLLGEHQPQIIYILGEPGYVSTFQVVRFARRHLPRAKLCLLAAQNLHQRFPPPFPWMERYVLAHLDHAFPLGRDHEEVLRRKGYRGLATRLPLGVDTRVFAPKRVTVLPGGFDLPRPVVGYVGDLLPARSLPLLIQAVSECPTPVGLLIVGDGRGRPGLERLAAGKGLDARARFAGRVPHAGIPNYLNYMDMLALPSKAVRNRCFGIFRIANAEQFGRVLVEAMACGKPVVGSCCGEIPNVVGTAGRVFPEGDAAALASVLHELASSPALRARLGQEGLARARTNYDWRVIAERLLAVMEGMLAPSAKAGIKARAPVPDGERRFLPQEVGAAGTVAR